MDPTLPDPNLIAELFTRQVFAAIQHLQFLGDKSRRVVTHISREAYELWMHSDAMRLAGTHVTATIKFYQPVMAFAASEVKILNIHGLLILTRIVPNV